MGYQETEMSKKARKILIKNFDPTSPQYKEAEHGGYKPRDRGHYMKDKGEIDIEKLAEDFGRMSYPENFLTYCISLGLEEREVHLVIKQNIKNYYGPENWKNQGGVFGGLAIAQHRYKDLCELFEITPEKSFPDWEGKEKIPSKLEGKVVN